MRASHSGAPPSGAGGGDLGLRGVVERTSSTCEPYSVGSLEKSPSLQTNTRSGRT